MSKAAKHQVIGKSQQRVDGIVKATGQAVYAMDLELPGMLHARVLRSPFPHARLVRIDATKAEALPGVVTVLTRETLDGMNPYFGSAYKDQTIVALDKVRYDGDPVAAVAADDEATAAEALELIETEYQELPAVIDIADAIAPDAPLVHEQVAEADELHGHAYRVPDEFRGTNICYAYDYARGDVDKGFSEADEIFEDTFTFPQIQHYPLEPHITIARVEDGHVTLWASTQDPFTLQRHIAEFFSIAINKVRVIVPHVGGAYGGKLSVKNEPLVAALAWKTGRTVKITHTSEDTFRTITRHPSRFRIKTGVTRDGRLVARECEVYMGTGAYADYGPRVSQKAGYRAPGPYRIPNVKVDSYTVYTNAVPAGAFRGFGTLQVTWAYESQMDMIARKLGIDPVEFRVRNLLKKGDAFTKGDTPVDCDLETGLRRTAKALGWGKEKGPNRGMGLACCMKDGGGTYKVASAAIKLNSDGSAVLFTGTVEIGQGCRTALAQVAAEELSLPYEAVTVAQLDTDSTPYDAATNASSSMVIMGLCVERAAAELKKQLRQAAAKLFKCKADKITFKNGHVSAGKGKRLSYEQVLNRKFGAKGRRAAGQGHLPGRSQQEGRPGITHDFLGDELGRRRGGGGSGYRRRQAAEVHLHRGRGQGHPPAPMRRPGRGRGDVRHRPLPHGGNAVRQRPPAQPEPHRLPPAVVQRHPRHLQDHPGRGRQRPGPLRRQGLGRRRPHARGPRHRQRHRRRRRRAHARASRHPGEDVAGDAGERVAAGSEGSFASLAARRRQCSSAFMWITTNAWLTSTWHSRT